ncbi:MAG: hypothetical protein LQ337_007476 [Flavoplaca oasis]|nr:MAG: hypothetical protein LQ337_007476 [Flavoplaca oasis]
MFRFSKCFMLLASLSILTISTTLAQQRCNGHASLCTRKYSNITFIGAHDSAFVGDSPADNQGISVTAQLDSGIRFLQSQAHTNSFETLSLCHTSCFLNDAGPLTEFLGTVKSWLDGHPDEVVTLLLGNGDRTDIARYGEAFRSSGLDKMAFIPATHPLAFDAWPTLGEVIDAGTRLVVFMDYGADVNKVDYIHDEFAYYFETPFNTLDPTFNQCSIDRPPNAKPEGRMYIMNHFLDKKLVDGGVPEDVEEQGKGMLEDIASGIFGRRGLGDEIVVPFLEKAEETNAKGGGEGSIGTQVEKCEGLYGRRPGVVLLDFVDEGEGVEAQRVLNGL